MGSSSHRLELPGGLGNLRIHPGGDMGMLFGDPMPHSRLSDGRTVVWEPANRDLHAPAVDAESVNTIIGDHVAARLGGDAQIQLKRWTQLEVVAKVTGTPAVLLLRQGYSEAAKGLALTTFSVCDMIVTMGWTTARHTMRP